MPRWLGSQPINDNHGDCEYALLVPGGNGKRRQRGSIRRRGKSLQHDTRDREPQLHVHQAILNRILCADGVWRALDSKAIHALRAAASAIGERVMEAHLAPRSESAARPARTARPARSSASVPRSWTCSPRAAARSA